MASTGCGKSVPYSTLSYKHCTNTEFIRNDCIHIKVKSVDVYSSHSIPKGPSWRLLSHDTQELCHCTLTHFNKHKLHKSPYFSDPFVTHENGYKMQLRVDVNHDGHGHIGVIVYLMKSPMDDILLWPFHGDVVVELLNWREDNDHHSRVIELSSNVSNSACSRVITAGVNEEVKVGESHNVYNIQLLNTIHLRTHNTFKMIAYYLESKKSLSTHLSSVRNFQGGKIHKQCPLS